MNCTVLRELLASGKPLAVCLNFGIAEIVACFRPEIQASGETPERT
jgi:hypothetical protein